jgi:hypothetical protein
MLKTAGLFSDNLNAITEKIENITIEKTEIPGFLSSGFTSGFNTLIKNIKKTRAGSNIELFHDGTYNTQTNYSFIPDKFFDDQTENLIITAESAFIDAGKNIYVVFLPVALLLFL